MTDLRLTKRFAVMLMAGGLVAGCGTSSPTKVDYKSDSKSKQVSLAVPPNMIDETADQRSLPPQGGETSLSALKAGSGASPVGQFRGGGAGGQRHAYPARRHGKLARHRQQGARAGMAADPPLLAGTGLPAGGRPARQGRDGNRLERNARADQRRPDPQHAVQGHGQQLRDLGAQQVPHAPGSGAERRHVRVRQPEGHARGADRHEQRFEHVGAEAERSGPRTGISEAADGGAGVGRFAFETG